jgi:hypothetical protein
MIQNLSEVFEKEVIIIDSIKILSSTSPSATAAYNDIQNAISSNIKNDYIHLYHKVDFDTLNNSWYYVLAFKSN